jgi:phosphoserine phosphatase RsbU/P
MSSQGIPDGHTLQCMEIWGGFEPMERSVSTPGLDLWVFSQPFHEDAQGGDVYYVTLCGGGLITRIVVADVSGHGASVAEFSSSLRTLLRRNINQKSQKRLVERLNRQFGAMAEMRRFATALVVTYLASTDRLSVSNAGHPRPLLYRAIDREWTSLTHKNGDGDRNGAGNLPLGIDEYTRYDSFDLQLEPGDRAVFYTDALIEAADSSGRLLGESGLLEAARGLDIEVDGSSPGAFGSALVEAVASHRGRESAEDDMTVVVLHHNAAAPPRLSLAQKADVYAKVFGLKRV